MCLCFVVFGGSYFGIDFVGFFVWFLVLFFVALDIDFGN